MKRKTKKLARWINAAGKERLAKAVARAERETAAEIVVMVSGRASTVEHVPALIFALLALLVALAALGYVHQTLGLSLALFLGLGFFTAVMAAYFGGSHPVAQRFFTHPRDRERQVSERAELEFYRRGMRETQGRTGVLIFIALMEHRVHILADKAIASHANESTWTDGVTAILEGIRADDLVGGIERALSLMAPVLARVAPAQADNPNELSDHVILIPE